MRIAILLALVLSPAVRGEVVPSSVKFLTDPEVRSAIRSAPEEQPGQPGLYFVRLSPDAEYPVIGIRRTVPTKAEVHELFTDVWYVIEGGGTLVTGGTLVESVITAPGENRGRAIKDGNSRRVQRGDFAVIPAGTPHWISAVEGNEILYIVVKMPARK
jgi:mannose-6-phosphate isomerase-like protein (cupin superfamily)